MNVFSESVDISCKSKYYKQLISAIIKIHLKYSWTRINFVLALVLFRLLL